MANLVGTRRRACRNGRNARVLALGLALPLAGCDSPQSTFLNAGSQSESVTTLFLVMASGAVVVWCLVMGVAIAAALGRSGRPSGRRVNLFIIGGGIVFPTLVLAALLAAGLQLLPSWQEDPGRLTIRVHGEQWWWRVLYKPADGPEVVSANEIHLPAGQEVEFLLTSADVIHSFWIPAIGGKMDMIPGRENRLLLEATKPGVYRGVCAEYCGTSHALMAFSAVVQEPEDFAAWLADRAQPAARDETSPGAALFLESGCGACHRVAGLVEKGEVGPDLTHFGSRLTLAAGIAENTRENLVRWIADPAAMKPAAEMPAYRMLPAEELGRIADFLLGLK